MLQGIARALKKNMTDDSATTKIEDDTGELTGSPVEGPVVRGSPRKLGRVQLNVISSLRAHKTWHTDCGWIWGTVSRTQRLMDSLVRSGHAVMSEENSRQVYRPIVP